MVSRRSEAWIFVSHSVKDLDAVRQIRNAIEERGANPILLFFKQSIDDELLKTLISREIDARNFFVLCDSQNARSSAYVQWEVAYVEKLKHIRRTTIDLAADWHVALEKIDALLSDATIFLSYGSSDWHLIKPFVDYLIGEDFSLFDPSRDISLGSDWRTAIQDAINEAGRTGHFLQFVTQKSLQSHWVSREFEFFQNVAGGTASGGPPMLVALEPLHQLHLPVKLQSFQILDVTTVPFQVAANSLKQALLR
jgi:hypothetical protein